MQRTAFLPEKAWISGIFSRDIFSSYKSGVQSAGGCDTLRLIRKSYQAEMNAPGRLEEARFIINLSEILGYGRGE